MNRAAFFDAIRPAFGGSLTAKQVEGMEALLDASEGLPIHHRANVLANARREVGPGMFPIKETDFAGKGVSDAVVKSRLTRAWKSGKLPWVKSDYWSGGFFGRGFTQLTHKRNYQKLGQVIGVDLVSDPSKALDLDIAAKIMVAGMRDGLFTGKKLADYDFPAALDASPSSNPRRIVNGKDGSDAEVAKFHRQFATALAFAEERAKEAQSAPSAPVPPSTPKGGLVAAILRLLASILKGRKA